MVNVNVVHVNAAGDSQRIDAVRRFSVMKMAHFMAVNVDVVLLLVHLDLQVKVAVLVEGIVMAFLVAPTAADLRVQHHFVLVVEARIHVQNDVAARQELDREVLMMFVMHFSVNFNRLPRMQAAFNGKRARNGWVMNMHDLLQKKQRNREK